MIEGFDKEIDAILRKARENEAVFTATDSQTLHLDADEISAFAENALPEKAKQLYTAHFADCDRCRRILSNLIALNSEAEAIPVTNVSTEIAAAASIPWYRKLFAMPNLAYTMGAFVLVFGGFLGVLVFQNVEKSESSISQATEPMSKQSGPSFNQNSDLSSADTVSNANASASNAMTTAANAAANTSSSAASNMAANTASQSYSSNAAAVAREETSSDKTETAKNAPVIMSTPPPAEAKPEIQTRDDAKARDAEEDVMVAAAPPPPPAPVTGQAANPKKAAQNKEESADKMQATRAAPASSRKIGGKTFRRINSAWVDGDYREGMPLTRIARGSDDYKKLDREVKNAAENLDGLVIVVWKSKGYRIQ